MHHDDIAQAVRQLAEQLIQQSIMVVTAESCTGGGIAQALTALAGSSRWFERGFVTYSNEAKQEMLGVLGGKGKVGRKADPQLKEIKALRSELKRKEKALAETAALLVLKKKARGVWGDNEDEG